MERYQKISEQKQFKEYVEHIRILEADRIFCCHGPEHLMDVARIAWINNLEQELGFSKDIIYGMALLHDIGKVKQYEEGIPHEVTGKEIAEEILRECGYDEEERNIITRAVFYHRKGNDPEKLPLSTLLYEADKASRLCMFCKAEKECNWNADTKNDRIND